MGAWTTRLVKEWRSGGGGVGEGGGHGGCRGTF